MFKDASSRRTPSTVLKSKIPDYHDEHDHVVNRAPRSRKSCPKCSSKNIKRCVYSDTMTARQSRLVKEGRAIVAGSVAPASPREWLCADCDFSWPLHKPRCPKCESSKVRRPQLLICPKRSSTYRRIAAENETDPRRGLTPYCPPELYCEKCSHDWEDDEPLCPLCGSDDVVRYIAGYVIDLDPALLDIDGKPMYSTLQDKIDRGKVVLTGCVISGNEVDLSCSTCGLSWNDSLDL